MQSIPEIVEGLPNLCGSEALIESTLKAAANRPVFTRAIAEPFGGLRSVFANALHMHQPLIPAGGGDLRTAQIIGNLQHMAENPGIGDNHNASVFRWCYKRMGEFIPQLLQAGHAPRIMLEYSGCLLFGLRQMGAHDVLDALRFIANDPACRDCVEWLGAPWGHAVAPSTPVGDFRLHVRAFQHHFAALFGLSALERLRGFSPSEMALPNHPDVHYEFVKTLKDCGYRWVLVQEHTVERTDGGPLQFKHVPHRLIAKNSHGQTLSITAIIKTQGSDTKLVAQMQPYYEAKSLSRTTLAGHSVPPLVTQIADGENGGVMMNEFPPKYLEVMAESSRSDVRPMNVSEYLEHLDALGVRETDLPAIQPIMQQRIWERFKDGAGPDALNSAIAELRKADSRFHMEGGSWTNNISWVRGYDHVLGPMEQASVLFAVKTAQHKVATSDQRYRKALFHLLCGQTSCYRYWGEGLWTDYGIEIIRRASEILKHDF